MWSLLVWDEPLLQKIIVAQSSACASFTCCTPDLTDIGNCYMQLLILLHKVLCNGTLAIPTVLRWHLAVWVSPCITSPCWLGSKAAKLQNAAEILMYLKWLWWVCLTFNASLWIRNSGPSPACSCAATINYTPDDGQGYKLKTEE